MVKIIDDGHRYEVENLEGGEPQVLQFIKKVLKEPDSTELVTEVNGTTNEEVLSVLIDRMVYLQNLLPCAENTQISALLDQAMALIKKRAADRDARGVRGTGQE